MVPHGAVGQKPHAKKPRKTLQLLQKELVVTLLVKHGPPLIAPIGHVVVRPRGYSIRSGLDI